MRPSMKLATLVLAASLAVAGAGLAGCNKAPQDTTTVVTTESNNVVGLTSIQRGQLREVTLAAAKGGWAAWKANDVEGMKPYFTPDLIAKYAAILDKLKAQGRTRVREFQMVNFDVTDMNNTGTQVIVDTKFYDDSYYIEKSGAKTKPSHHLEAAELTINKQDDGSWKIVRFYAPVYILN